MNAVTKKIMIIVMCLSQVTCWGVVSNEVFLDRLVTKVLPASVIVGLGCGSLLWVIESGKSNEEYRAQIEAKAESLRMHYSTQVSQARTEEERIRAQSHLSNMTGSSALEKEVARVKSDDELTHIKLRQARRSSRWCGVAAGTAIAFFGAQWAAI